MSERDADAVRMGYFRDQGRAETNMKSIPSKREDGASIVEFLAILVIVAFFGAILLYGFAYLYMATHDGHRRPSCANNLKQIGLAMKMYANESKGERYPRQMYHYEREVDCDDVAYPPVGEPVANLEFMFHFDDMYPEYLPDIGVLVCPENEYSTLEDMVNPVTGEIDRFRKCAEEGRGWHAADDSYWYIGHLLDKTGAEERAAPYSDFAHLGRFCEDDAVRSIIPSLNLQLAKWMEIAFRELEQNPKEFVEFVDFDWTVDELRMGELNEPGTTYFGNGKTSTLSRLREGIERMFLGRISGPGPGPAALELMSKFAIVYDRPTIWKEHSAHEPYGGNVLYMDGHVEFVEYPGRFPFYPGAAWVSECIRTGRAE